MSTIEKFFAQANSTFESRYWLELSKFIIKNLTSPYISFFVRISWLILFLVGICFEFFSIKFENFAKKEEWVKGCALCKNMYVSCTLFIRNFFLGLEILYYSICYKVTVHLELHMNRYLRGREREGSNPFTNYPSTLDPSHYLS